MTATLLIITSHVPSLLSFRLPIIKQLQNGYKVVCAGDFDAYPEARLVLESNNVNCCPLLIDRSSINPLNFLISLVDVFKLICRVRPSVVFAYSIKTIIFAGLISRILTSIRLIPMVCGVGFIFSSDRLFARVLRFLCTPLFKFATYRARGIIFHNSFDQKYLEDIGALRRGVHSLVVAGSGVDTAFFCPDSDTYQRRKGVTPNMLRFVMISRMLRDKGVEEYCSASASVKAKFCDKNLRFQLVGPLDSNPEAFSEAELDELILKSGVDYVGKQTDLLRIYWDSDIVVLPSYREGRPRVLLEAAACGLPIITTNVPGCSESVIENVSGVLVTRMNVDSLVDAMSRFVECRQLVDKMGAEGRTLALRRFNDQVVAADMFEFITKVS